MNKVYVCDNSMIELSIHIYIYIQREREIYTNYEHYIYYIRYGNIQISVLYYNNIIYIYNIFILYNLKVFV